MYVLNRNKIHDIISRLNKLLRKQLVRLAQQSGIFAPSAGAASKLLHSHSCKEIVFNENYNTPRTASLKFSNLYPRVVRERSRSHFDSLQQRSFSWKISFSLRSIQHYIKKFDVMCAKVAIRIVGLLYFHRFVTHIFFPIFEHLTITKELNFLAKERMGPQNKEFNEFFLNCFYQRKISS